MAEVDRQSAAAGAVRVRTVPMRILILVVAAVAASGLIAASWISAPDGGITLDRAVFTPHMPADGSSGEPEIVDLPHSCRPVPDHEGCRGVYRLAFEGPDAAGESWAVYIPTFSTRVAVLVNGVFLIDSQSFYSGTVVRQTVPLQAVFPSDLLRPGRNEIEIRLDNWIPFGGFLDRVHVGPESIIGPAFQARHLLLNTLPRLLVAWQGALALALLIVWIGVPEESMYLILTAILVLSVLFGLPQFLAGQGWPERLLRAANFLGIWQASLMPLLMARLVECRPPIGLRWSLSVPAIIASVFVFGSIVPILPFDWAVPVWTMVAAPWVTVMFGLAVGIVLRAALVENHTEARVIAGGLAVGAVLAGHDVLLFFGVLSERRAFLSGFVSPIVMTVISAALMWRFAKAMNEVSRFNQVLREEVARAEAAQRASFAREQEQIRARALEAERLRLTHDLHDGLAGQLVSIVSQCELRGEGYREIGVAARRALEDLRLVVASLDDVGNDLAMMLAEFRERIEPQLRGQGVELEWRMSPLPDVEGLRSEHALALFRILQEAVTNAVRHSGCSAVSITMAPVDPGRGVRIVVADRGCGGVVERVGGRGVGNMRRRAEALGASFHVDSDSTGTRVTIELPQAFPDLVLEPARS